MGLIAPAPAPTTTASRALVVNAEPPILLGLTVVLRGAGYVVESAPTAADALAVVVGDAPEVLVLELGGAGGESVELCARVRRFSDVPILILSPAGAQREVVRALNAGANDYVPNPFRRQELLDRLRGIVVPASAGPAAGAPLEVGELVVDLDRRRVSRDGTIVLLEPAEFELVCVLARHRGRVVTDRQLLAVWGDQRGEDTRCLRVAVARLRAKLERDPWRSGYLIAEPGLGYRLCPPAEVIG